MSKIKDLRHSRWQRRDGKEIVALCLGQVRSCDDKIAEDRLRVGQNTLAFVHGVAGLFWVIGIDTRNSMVAKSLSGSVYCDVPA